MADDKKRGGFLLHMVVVAIAVWAATEALPGVSSNGPIPVLIMAVVLGLVNAIVRPVLLFVTFPLTVITLGLFYFVVNGLAFNLAAALVPGFGVDGLMSGILAGIVVSVVSWLIGLVLGTNR